MSLHLCLRVEFLAPLYHGREDDDVPEWPPSPHRVLQALVAAAAARERCGLGSSADGALRWLEGRPAPTVVATAGRWSDGYVLSVPNNAMDIVARAWARGNESGVGDANPAVHRALKPARPTYLTEPCVVYYLWTVDGADAAERLHVETIATLARSVTTVGWGIDQVVSYVSVIERQAASELAGDRWQPVGGSGGRRLRAPVRGSLDDMRERHERFVRRVGPNGFEPTPPLKAYAKLSYRRDVDPAPVEFAAFSLLKPDGASFRVFSTASRALTVAGMLRHATRRAAEQAGWSAERVNAEVLGHPSPSAGSVTAGSRFAFIPVPSLEYRDGGAVTPVVGDVRRVLLTAVGSSAVSMIDWVRLAMPDMDLMDESTGEVRATLARLAATDAVLRRYVTPSAEWATVTPVVLPGYDDPAHYRRRIARGVTAEEQRRLLQRLHSRLDRILRKATVQSGFPVTLARHAEIEWRASGFWPGNDRADRYGVPDHLRRYLRYHVRVSWRDESGNPVAVPGPIVIGAGRYHGLGLFASLVT